MKILTAVSVFPDGSVDSPPACDLDAPGIRNVMENMIPRIGGPEALQKYEAALANPGQWQWDFAKETGAKFGFCVLEVEPYVE